ncbi:UDP-glucose dehydrogenase family protein [Streptomyces sp. WMMC1477]|uniref:UDP-glucose dehydrogenase family protein n=1 Tax=Streptomyces sp. WMMC1477 TaxID=3015155 RepID=UPI0022B6CB82|nr:UDP-glucose/GDP-mannose dehydrogenase family protein [Streptomyces sp. WMMC1477]MCZ7432938.1 UDP-glucose/GDP-mannose dehydrogenase family protein [Streptomyces sp. WMMC1477]
MRLTVIGTGYLGAVHAACMAELGHDVLGVDVDTRKISALAEGRPPFYEPGLPELLTRTLHCGRLRFTTSLREAAEFGDVHFVCVGTPQQPDSDAADLRQVEAVVHGLAPHLRRRCLIVGKSTVPVGTCDRLAAEVAALLPEDGDAELAWNPEFLREGFAVQDTLRPDRLVIGVRSTRAHDALAEVYATPRAAGVPFISTDPATAELAKVAANSFLATKISFINAMSEVCDAAGADVVTLADILGHDTRIGRRFLAAGLGFGGGCLPKDIRAFTARAAELGAEPAVDFLRQIDTINTRQRRRTVEAARDLVGGSFLARRVAVLGATFKPDSDDVRDSPALAVAGALHREGAEVCVHDPRGTENARAAHPALLYTTDATAACRDADLVLHLTEWRDYRELRPSALAEVVRTPRLLDARNALDAGLWRSAGWAVRSLGRPAPAVVPSALPLQPALVGTGAAEGQPPASASASPSAASAASCSAAASASSGRPCSAPTVSGLLSGVPE